MQVGDFLKGTALREHPAEDWIIAVSFWLVGVVLLLVTRGSLGVRSAAKDLDPSSARMRKVHA